MRKEKEQYILAIIMLLIFSSIFLFIPIANVVSNEYSRVVTIGLGVLFWATGIIGYWCLIKVHLEEKKYRVKRKAFLYSNVITSIADTAFIIGIVILILLVLNQLTDRYVVYVNIFVIIISFNAHLLFSKNFQKKLLFKNTEGRKKK